MLRPLLLGFLLFLTTLLPAAAGAVKARPLSGIGLLVMRADLTLPKGEPPRLLLYRDPMLGRLGERPADRLPGLAPAMVPVDREWYAIVTAIRPGWLRIIYDDAERKGWVAGRKSLGFRRWGEFLQGRRISMLPGIRKDYYLLRDKASLAAASREDVGKTGLLSVEKLEGDWAYVKTGSDLSGWLRWRDDNDRLLILLNPQLP